MQVMLRLGVEIARRPWSMLLALGVCSCILPDVEPLGRRAGADHDAGMSVVNAAASSASLLDSGCAVQACSSDRSRCSAGDCAHGGRCVDEEQSQSCDCEGTGYGGAHCETPKDPCDGVQCAPGLVCSSATGMCAASCARTGCRASDVCSADAECRTGGDQGAYCDPDAKRCVAQCEGGFLGSPSDDKIAYCREMSGGDINLYIYSEPCPFVGLPRLVRAEKGISMRGSIPAGMGNLTRGAYCGEVVFDALTWVGGDLDTSLGGATQMRFPKLVHVGEFSLVDSRVGSVSMPELTTIEKRIYLDNVRGIARFEVNKLSSVTAARITGACELPYSSVAPIVQRVPAVEPNRYGDIGCCVADPSEHYGCNNSSCSCKAPGP